MQVTGSKLQMSTLKTTEADGIYPNGRYEPSAFPYKLDSACVPATPQTTVCGNWTQPCQSDGGDDVTNADYTVDFVYGTIHSKQSYSMNRTDYTPGTTTTTTTAAATVNGSSLQLLLLPR